MRAYPLKPPNPKTARGLQTPGATRTDHTSEAPRIRTHVETRSLQFVSTCSFETLLLGSLVSCIKALCHPRFASPWAMARTSWSHTWYSCGCLSHLYCMRFYPIPLTWQYVSFKYTEDKRCHWAVMLAKLGTIAIRETKCFWSSCGLACGRKFTV